MYLLMVAMIPTTFIIEDSACLKIWTITASVLGKAFNQNSIKTKLNKM